MAGSPSWSSTSTTSFLPFSSFFHLRLGPVPLVCCSKPDDYLTTRRRTTFAVFVIATLVASLSGTVLDGPLIHLQFRRPYNALSTFFNFPTMSGVVPFQNGQAAGLAVSAPLPLCTQPPTEPPADPGTKRAQVIVGFSAVSLIAVDFVWLRVLYVAISQLRNRAGLQKLNRERHIFHSQLGAYMASLLISNLFASVAGILNSAWLSAGHINSGPLCTSQGKLAVYIPTAISLTCSRYTEPGCGCRHCILHWCDCCAHFQLSCPAPPSPPLVLWLGCCLWLGSSYCHG